MATVFAQITGAIVAALAASPAVSAQIHRSRVRPISADWTTAVVVTPQSADLERLAIRGAPINLESQIEVVCFARAVPGQSPDVAVDALLSAVYARLVADPTLGGLALDLAPARISYEFDAEAEQVASVTLALTVQHQAAALTLDPP